MVARPPTVILPTNEFAARVHIVAWLGYPYHAGKRERAMGLVHHLARNSVGQAIKGRKDRIDGGLVQLGRMVNRQLLAGEIFRRQILASLPEDPGIFGNVSETSFAKRMATFHGRPRDGTARHDYGAEHRDYWRSRRGCLALAIGACIGKSVRPDLADLLFASEDWTRGAVQIAEQQRQIAQAQGNRTAPFLIEFRQSDGF